ncbi:hypothetical protein PsYK624_035160 [Phanerochaete sordida]|uniref:Transmembrane protein n=1 Tax=Phanerochaete sordida TaxID=48140 RepID=A0A9P3LAY0_9APHY|nr:hypothetical protein PsYK624_035160 [Phanerochaete sordida]
MPVYNITIDDASPLIQYDGWWADTSHGDPSYVDYYDQTFHATETTGGTAGLTFNGSAVYLFGANRFNHDGYTVTVDDQDTTGNGYSASALFQQILFNQTGLSLSQEHQISLSNTPAPAVNAYVDLDYVIITAGDGDASTQSQDIVWDDSMAQYSSGWDDSPNGLESNYFHGTMHRTSVANAYASLTFEGNAVGVYGTTSVDHGFFNVSLDGSPPIKLNGTMIPTDQRTPRYQNLLYWAGGLSSGSHTVTITNIDTNNLSLDLDKFVVSRWSQSGSGSSVFAPSSTGDLGAATTTTGLQDSGSSGRSHHIATGAIAGSVVAGIVIAALIALELGLCLRRRHHRRYRSEPTSAHIFNSLLGDGGIVVGLIEPFTSIIRAGSSSHERKPFGQTSPVANPNLHGATSTSAPTSSTAAPRYIPHIDLDQQGTPATAPSPGAEIELEPVWLPAENPHQDFPPPSYAQATAAGSSSRGPLPLPVPPSR